MRMLGQQFVAGETITEALERGREREARGYRYSYDMLGEAALTAAEAALLRLLRRCDPRDRQGERRTGCLYRARDLGQAFGIAPATCAPSASG